MLGWERVWRSGGVDGWSRSTRASVVPSICIESSHRASTDQRRGKKSETVREKWVRGWEQDAGPPASVDSRETEREAKTKRWEKRQTQKENVERCDGAGMSAAGRRLTANSLLLVTREKTQRVVASGEGPRGKGLCRKVHGSNERGTFFEEGEGEEELALMSHAGTEPHARPLR